MLYIINVETNEAWVSDPSGRCSLSRTSQFCFDPLNDPNQSLKRHTDPHRGVSGRYTKDINTKHMNETVYEAVLDCYNHPVATVGKGWNQDENLAETSYQFKIFDDFYYQLFAPIYD